MSKLSRSGVLKFQIQKQITCLFKEYLNLLEESESAAANFEKRLAEMGIDGDFCEEKKRAKARRKKVLDVSNDTIRDLQSQVQKMFGD